MDRARAWLARLSTADRIVLGLMAVVVALFALSSDDPPARGTARSFDAWAMGLFVLASVALLASKRFPGTVVLVVIGLSLIWYSNDYVNGLINAPTLVAFYQLGATGDRRRELGIGAAALALPVAAILVFSQDRATQVISAVGWPVAAILLGEHVRSRGLLLTEYAEKAELAEAEREAETERRVDQERLDIARDVHDVLAHAVAVMTVQAGVAADAQDRDPAAVKAALATIRSAGKDAMAEMRTTVAVLRGTGPTEMAPTPGLDRLADLVDGARAEGLDVELTVDLATDPGMIPVAHGIESLVQLTAYRVVQESLTNVIRHAHASHAVVRVERRHQGGLAVEVTDDGRPQTASMIAPRVCYGLRGMRERVESLGGTLRFGPCPDGGWKVAASIPTRIAVS